MALFPRDVFTALQSTLANSSYLSYVDTVVIRKYRRNNLPDFSYYAIVISPSTAQGVFYPAAQRQIGISIELVLLGKMLQGEEDAVMADSPSSSPPNVGILAMYEDVFYTLYNNTLGGAIELYPGLNELDAISRFDVIVDEEREGFIMEGRMTYQVKGERFVSLP